MTTLPPAQARIRQRIPRDLRTAEVYARMWERGLTTPCGRLWLSKDTPALADQLGISTGYIRQLLDRLVSAGRIDKLQQGVWLLPQELLS